MEERTEPKQPIEMTSDELLEYSVGRPVAEKLKAIVREGKSPEKPESEDVDC